MRISALLISCYLRFQGWAQLFERVFGMTSSPFKVRLNMENIECWLQRLTLYTVLDELGCTQEVKYCHCPPILAKSCSKTFCASRFAFISCIKLSKCKSLGVPHWIRLQSKIRLSRSVIWYYGLTGTTKRARAWWDWPSYGVIVFFHPCQYSVIILGKDYMVFFPFEYNWRTILSLLFWHYVKKQVVCCIFQQKNNMDPTIIWKHYKP